MEKKQQMNIKIATDLHEALQETAKKWKCSVSELVIEGAIKELAWREVRDELDMPKKLTFDEDKRFYEAEPEYRQKFLEALEKRVPIPYTVKG